MKKTYHYFSKKSGTSHLFARFLYIFLCYMMAVNVQAQQNIKITGTVIDESGEPVIGATVTVVNQQIVSITDVDGQFSLSAPSNAELKITYIGYLAQTVLVNGQNTISIILKEDLLNLDEVIVIGYGAVKKRDLTGSVTSVKAEDIILSPSSNPMQALQGRVPGLDITRESGQPGEDIKMQLRGNKSFYASGTPLFIIDGLPGDYTTLNANDIESIEVLKDASSTAVYGSQGANGIVIITTKKGKEGKPVINLNSYIGLNGWSKVPKVRIGESYIRTLREAHSVTGNWTTEADDSKLFTSAETYEAYLDNKWIDWTEETLKNGYQSNTSISISGGNERTKAYVSFNFSDEVGQYTNDNNKIYSTQINVDHKIAKWISTGINLQASYTHRNKRGAAKLDRALAQIPLGEVYDTDGNLNLYPTPGDENRSILLDEQSGVYKNRINKMKLYANPYIEIRPIKDLTIISRLNGTVNTDKTRLFQGIGSYNYYQNGYSYAYISNTVNYNYKWENIATYNFNIADKHNFTFTGVSSWSHNQRDYDYMDGRNITDNKYLWYNMGSVTDKVIDSSYEMNKLLAYVGRINYSYLGKYLFSASVRHEGSSVLADGHKWSTYPAVSGAWRMSEESFMNPIRSWLDNLKIRAGWGVAGTANIDSFKSRSTLEQGFLSIGNTVTPIYRPSENVTNNYLSWEKSYNTNIGLDMGFLGGRIDFAADYYITNTKGVIYERNLPPTLGAYNSSKQYKTYVNLLSTQNKGFEFALNTRNVISKDFNWNSTITFSANNEKIRKLQTKDQQEIIDNTKGYIYRVGEPIYSYYSYHILGVWQKGEETDAAVFGKKPGDYKLDTPGLTRKSEGVYVDAEGNEYTADNTYTYGANDYQVLGHNSPDWSMGFQNTFTYKDFDLTIYLYARWGQMIKYDLLSSYDPTGKQNFPEYFDYWTESNPANDFPAVNAGEEFKNYEGYQARAYVDGSFFKVKNITLGYTLPKKTMNKAGIEKFRIYGTITNPFIYSKSHLIKDYDPEMNGSISYPLTKQLVFGLNLTF